MKLFKRIICSIAAVMFSFGGIAVTAETIPLLQVSASLSSNTITLGESVSIIAVASGGNSRTYSYFFSYSKSSSASSWSNISNGDGFGTFKADSAGTYFIKVQAECGYETCEQILSLEVKPKPTASQISLNASISANSVYINENVTVNITPSGGSGSYKYAYWYRSATKQDTDHYCPGANDKVDYKSHTFTLPTPGTYVITAVVYDKSDLSRTAKETFLVSFNDKPVVSSGLVDKTTITMGEDITLLSSAHGSSGSFTYKITYSLDSAPEVILQDFSTTKTTTFTPTKAGKYVFNFSAKSSTGAVGTNTGTTTVKNIQSTSKISKSEVYQGETIELTAGATGGFTPYQYKFEYTDSANQTTVIKDFSNSASATFNTEKPGKYKIRITTKDSKGNLSPEEFDVNIKQYVLKDATTFSSKSVVVGDKIKVTAAATGGAEPYTYEIYQKKLSATEWQSAGTSASVELNIPDVAGYEVKVIIKDKFGNSCETITTVYVVAEAFTRQHMNEKIDEINDWLDDIGFEKVISIIKNAVSDNKTFNDAWAGIVEYMKSDDLEVKSDNPADNIISEEQEKKLKSLSLSYFNSIKALDDETRTEFSFEYADLNYTYNDARSAKLEMLHNAGFATKWALKMLNNISSLANNVMTTMLTSRGIGLDYKAFANEYSGLFDVFASSFVVLFLTVNLLETTVQYELFTLKGGVKFAIKLIMCKVWISLSVKICSMIVDICNEMMTTIFDFSEVALHFTLEDVSDDTGSTILGEIVGFLTSIAAHAVSLVLIAIILIYIVKILMKLTIRTFELGMLMIISPLFFAAWVGDTTKQYFKRFMSAFLSVTFEIVFMSVIWFAFTYWFENFTTYATNATFIEGFAFLGFGSSVIVLIVLLAIVKMMYQPPRVIENLLS